MMLKLGHFRHTLKVFGMWCCKTEISLTTVWEMKYHSNGEQ
jgi:hypothetical protein